MGAGSALFLKVNVIYKKRVRTGCGAYSALSRWAYPATSRARVFARWSIPTNRIFSRMFRLN